MSENTSDDNAQFRADLAAAGEFYWDGPGLMKVIIISFGYLHEDGVPPSIVDEAPEFIVDVRKLFRDPHHDPAFRQRTGRDDAVRARVLDQPGAIEFAQSQAATIAALIPGRDRAAQPTVIRIAIGCSGGRHRSVVLAESIALVLNRRDIGTYVEHQHINRPVVER